MQLGEYMCINISGNALWFLAFNFDQNSGREAN